MPCAGKAAASTALPHPPERAKRYPEIQPSRTATATLLLATWNIREFDAGQKASFRSDECYYYMAEILSRFDLIAVQEVRDGLDLLQLLQKTLGK